MVHFRLSCIIQVCNRTSLLYRNKICIGPHIVCFLISVFAKDIAYYRKKIHCWYLKTMIAVGFELTHPKLLLARASTLDHSATCGLYKWCNYTLHMVYFRLAWKRGVEILFFICWIYGFLVY
jgi:hypothetical protein